MTLEEVLDTIKSNDKDSIARIVYVPKANRSFVAWFTINEIKQRQYQIVLLDEDDYMRPATSIEYNLDCNSCYIEYFITRYDYQGTGLGKYVYQMTQAHADKVGQRYSSGTICPVAKIKGVSNTKIDKEENEHNEYKFLQLMYHALGNEIKQTWRGHHKRIYFEDSWAPNEKYNKLNQQQKAFVDKLTNLEQQKYNEYLEEGTGEIHIL